jgi:fumarylacetoacetase
MSRPSRSFVAVPADGHFPIQNLPWGVCRRPDRDDPRVCVAIGDRVLDLREVESAGLLERCDRLPPGALSTGRLNELMAAGRPAWTQLRATVARLLAADEPALRDDRPLRERALLAAADVEMLLPAAIGDYTDFYSSKEHATNVGIMFRGVDNALMPNWLHLPVAYHGRASSVVPSGTAVRRPWGQVLPEGADRPSLAPTRLLDFELEVGFFVGPGTRLGQSVPVERALDHVFGLVLVNDWSARDIQKWEYQPLGPFLSKSFATSISPWVVPLEALEPFRTAGPPQDPEPLPYLRQPQGRHSYDIRLDVSIRPAGAVEATTVSVSSFRHVYWSIAQQLAHHTVAGCDLRSGDLMASGTISGPSPSSFGSLLELTWRGTKPLALAGGETRTFLHDGDRVAMTGWCQADDHRIGFGEVAGVVLPAHE